MNSTEKSASVFGMVTTAASREYTPLALRSFFRHTALGPDDRFILIDNDSSFELPADVPAARITVVRPAAPQGFAVNGNLLLSEARKTGADLFFLNNDLVFTSGWLEPLLADRPALLSPLSNAQIAASAGGFTTQPCMDLADYTGHESAVETIAASVRERGAGYRMTASAAFFCIKIPRAVYEKVGTFDERFGKGGGEDRDYTIRAWMAGIPQEYALQSYVLHFQGRSTWRGAETPEEQALRDAKYSQAFQQKWGAALTYAFLGGDWNLFRSDKGLSRFIETEDFTAVVRRLRSRPGLEPFIKRQRNAQFAAVCVLYDDDSWLAAAVESVYESCQTIWFLVGERPWNGAPTDQTALLERLEALPDPARKIRIVRGDWPDEATQRNDGLRFVGESGADYCFVLDADEIYDPAQLRDAMALVRQNPQIDCWRASCLTYWKSERYRVDPPEAIAAAVFVRVGTGRFIENRTYQSTQQETTFSQDTLVFHHMSYARTDEQILRKITTFGHASQVVPGWYENVWRRWDTDRAIENLNPCWPAAYRRIVEQPVSALPPVLRRTCRSDDKPAHVTVSLSKPVEPQLAELKQSFPPGAEAIVRPEGTPFRFRCRVHSSDVPVIFDTFVGLYHVPPVPMPDNAVIVDLGANIGCTMVHYASLYPAARIVGVELDPDNARLASINTAALPSATVVNAAVWPNDGTVTYAGEEAWGYKVEAGGGRTIAALSMPSLMARYNLDEIDFLKVDIEGAERQLFAKNVGWLSKVHALAIEVHDDESLITDLIAKLRARGFEAARDTHHWSAVIAARPNWSERRAS